MKRFALVFIFVLMLFTMMGCSSETQYEKAAREAERRAEIAQENYDRAVQEYNDLSDSISRYNAAVDALGG